MKIVFNLVELQGLEPWTSSMPWMRSSQLSYSPASFWNLSATCAYSRIPTACQYNIYC